MCVSVHARGVCVCEYEREGVGNCMCTVCMCEGVWESV